MHTLNQSKYTTKNERDLQKVNFDQLTYNWNYKLNVQEGTDRKTSCHDKAEEKQD